MAARSDSASADFVDAPEALVPLLARLDETAGAPVSLDTEADSFHHYFEKICLLQLEVEGATFVVDPLAGLDLAPLLSRLASRILLMHGADYDLRLLYRGYRFRAGALFDTMVAAQLLGESEIGLAALLKKRLGVLLDKGHQRADWSARPLEAAQLAYAEADVLHLPPLVASLTADLEAKGRLPWHAEECARLLALSLPTERASNPENDWRIKGTNAITAKERAFVRAFWHAREEQARALDRPQFRILPNEKILAAARLAAAGEGNLAILFPSHRPLPAALERALSSALASARALPPSAWPEPKRGEKTEADPALEREIERLKKRRDERAKELGLDPGVLASRATLAAAAHVARARDRLDVEALVAEAGLTRWRAELLAE